jgi:Mg2+/Co2+ transporter CorB
MSWQLPTDGPKTLNGLIIEYLEEIPQSNISLRIAGYPVEIIDVADNMIKSVRVMPEHFIDENKEEE